MFESSVSSWWNCLGNSRRLVEVYHRVSLCQSFSPSPVHSQLLLWQHACPLSPSCSSLWWGDDKFSSFGSYSLSRFLPIISWLDHVTNTSNHVLRTKRGLKRDNNYMIWQHFKGTEVWCKSRLVSPSSSGSLPFTKTQLFYKGLVH